MDNSIKQNERALEVLAWFGIFILYLLPGCLILLFPIGGIEILLNESNSISTKAGIIIGGFLLSFLISVPCWCIILIFASIPCYVLTGKSAFKKLGLSLDE